MSNGFSCKKGKERGNTQKKKMAEETKQRSNFKDQMKELSAVDYGEYNKKVATLKKKWFDLLVENVCSDIKWRIKNSIEHGNVGMVDGKRAVSCYFTLQSSYYGSADLFRETPDEEEAERLYEQFRKIPKLDEGKIEKFFNVLIVCCSPYVIYKCNVYKKRLFIGNIYNHTYEFYYSNRMLEFLNKLRERLSQDGIELRSITQRMDGARFHNLVFTRFDEHHIITAQDEFFGKDYSDFYACKSVYDGEPIYPQLYITMEV